MTRIAINGLGRMGKLALRRMIDEGMGAQIVLLYDAAGDAATRKLFENVDDSSKLADMRSYYAGYEDLNAWLLGRKV